MTNPAMPTSITANAATVVTRWNRRSSAIRHGLPQHEQPHGERAEHERDREEEQPASHVVLPRGSGRTDRIRGWGRSNADPEREHPGRRVPVDAGHPPAHGVALALESPETGVETTRRSSDRRAPQSTVPSGASTCTARDVIVSGSLKRSTTAVGGVGKPSTASPERLPVAWRVPTPTQAGRARPSRPPREPRASSPAHLARSDRRSARSHGRRTGERRQRRT